MKVSVGVSNRHVHLTDETLKILFGENHKLEQYRPINQIGQFASYDFVSIKTEKSIIERVRILGPTRNYNQVEISKTDAIKLGLKPPIRQSGNLINSETVTLIGPKGEVTLENSCIIADRHLHATKEDYIKYNLTDVVKIKVDGIKGGILDNVFVRVADNSYFEIHLDTDDANANLINNGDFVTIIKEEE